jgi:hypothetical protein
VRWEPDHEYKVVGGRHLDYLKLMSSYLSDMNKNILALKIASTIEISEYITPKYLLHKLKLS